MTTRSKPFRYLALAVFLSIGAGVIWAIVFGFSFSILQSIIYSNSINEHLRYTRSGVPVIGMSKRYSGVTSYRTLDGKPVEISCNNTGYWPFLPEPTDPQKRFHSPRWSQRITQIYLYNSPDRWFFICDGGLSGHGYMVGYDIESKMKIGYLGRNGFQSDEPQKEEQFPVDGRMISTRGIRQVIITGVNSGRQHNLTYLLTDNGLVQINLKNRTVKLILKETDLISSCVIDSLQTDSEIMSDKATSSQLILLRTPDRVLVFDPNDQKIQSYLLPSELRHITFGLIPLPDGNALVRKILGPFKPNELLWIDTTGKIIKHRDVNLRNPLRLSNTTQALVASFCVPSFGVGSGILVCCPWGPASAQSLGYWAALSKGFHECWPALLFTVIVGVILAILCYRRQRKYGLEWTWVWTGFVLLFGLPAFLGYLAYRRWPTRLECPSCATLAPRDREACFSCSQNFPEPASKGTEVFA